MFERKPMNNNYGMLFDMAPLPKIHSHVDEKYIYSFRYIFLDENMKIIGFKENNEPHSLKSIMIDKPSRYVLEMNGGSKSET